MTQATLIGIDLAKHVFHAHDATDDGTPIFRKKLSRNEVLPYLSAPPHCLEAMEVCATAHGWAREIGKLVHVTKLVPLCLTSAPVGKIWTPISPLRGLRFVEII